MLPIVDKPAIQYAVEEAVQSGIEMVIMVTGRGKRAIEDHFDRSIELEAFLREKGKLDILEQMLSIPDMINLAYLRQKEALGLGHAILVTRHLVGDEPFAVVLGDDIVDAEVPALRQMIDAFHATGGHSVIAVQRVPWEDVSKYGIVDAEAIDERLHRVKGLVEKPDPSHAASNLAIIGRYVLTPAIFDHLARTQADARGEIQLTNGLRSLLAEEEIYVYEFEGKRYDAGNKLGFLKATVEFALKREDLGPEFREYLRSLQL
jgi:UTP--glucose-1-phosphate uridylyltransferase